MMDKKLLMILFKMTLNLRLKQMRYTNICGM